MSVQITSATDVLLALLYAKGSTGRFGESIAGTTRLEKLMYLLNEESDLNNVINQDYVFVPDDFGPCAHELFDDIEMLKDAGIVLETHRKSYSQLDEGDTETCEIESLDIGIIIESTGELRVFSLTEKGMKIGKIIYDSLSEKQKEKISIFKTLYNKKPVSEIIKYVYMNYPEMLVESKIKDKVLQKI